MRSSIAATARPATPRGISSRAILPCLRLRFPAPACYAACCRGCAGPTRSRAGRFLIWSNRNWCSSPETGPESKATRVNRTRDVTSVMVKGMGHPFACKGFAKPSSGLRLPLAVHNELPPGAALRGGWTTMVKGWATPVTTHSVDLLAITRMRAVLMMKQSHQFLLCVLRRRRSGHPVARRVQTEQVAVSGQIISINWQVFGLFAC